MSLREDETPVVKGTLVGDVIDIRTRKVIEIPASEVKLDKKIAKVKESMERFNNLLAELKKPGQGK